MSDIIENNLSAAEEPRDLTPRKSPVVKREQETIQKKRKRGDYSYERSRDKEKVKGKFIFHEVPGGEMKFCFKAYKGDQLERFTLRDGEIYTLPLGVAKHLNKNCWYPVHQWAVDGNGKPLATIGQKVRRCSFQSLEFVDIEDLTPVGTGGLSTVEFV